MISVLHWGAHPDEDSESCFQGFDCDTEAEALAEYHKTPKDRSVQYIEIDLSDADCNRLGITRLRKNPCYIPSKDDGSDDREWQREQAMQAGMAFGVAGYNDAMGYDSEEPPDSFYR